MPTMVGNRTKLVVESAEAVLGLHWFVARDHTAKEEGLEIEIIMPGIKTKFDWTAPVLWLVADVEQWFAWGWQQKVLQMSLLVGAGIAVFVATLAVTGMRLRHLRK